MTASLDSALRAALGNTWPREAFAESLLAALREASISPLGVIDAGSSDGHGRWLFAGTVAGAVGAAGVAVLGVRRRLRRGSAA
ncbi:MAG: hypothetical protein ABR529_00855 [Actinomycetota bacterium]